MLLRHVSCPKSSPTPKLQTFNQARPQLSASDRSLIHAHSTINVPIIASHILTNAPTLTALAPPVAGSTVAAGVPVILTVPLPAGIALAIVVTSGGPPFAVVIVVTNGVTVACAGTDAAAANEARAALAADSMAGPRGSVAVWERTEEVREAKQYVGMVVRVVVIVLVATDEMGGALVGSQLLWGSGEGPEREWSRRKEGGNVPGAMSRSWWCGSDCV